ncbi:transcription elongation factor GreA [Candidatus Uhrbacteria bacterium]|nr:transcription elongation factor GreA [Candidatus Uhrbacteria bacterium]
MSTYLSQEKLDDLKRELEERTRKTRREIAGIISSAKELGDLSENFEYQDAKEQQALNEARILQIEEMIHTAVLVEQTSGTDIIDLGCTFLAVVNGKEKTFTLVGSTEADPISGKISNESPIGQALVGRRVGDTASINVPSGVIEYKIMKIL